MNVDTSFENSVIKQENTENDKVSAMLRAGIKAAQAGNRSEARHLLLNVTEADTTNENAWLWLASISEYPEELLVFLRNVLNINPANERAIEWSKATKTLLAKTFVQRGIDAQKQEQPDFAKQCFLQAIFNDDQNELAWLWLASITEAVEEKISHLQKVLRINPENATAYASFQAAKSQKAHNLMRRANAAAVSGQTEEANTILDEILQNSPDLEDAWILKSYLANSFDEKLKCFERVLEINPSNETAQTSVNSLRMMKSAVEPEVAQETSVHFEEKNQTEAVKPEVVKNQESNSVETESPVFKSSEETEFFEEANFEEQVPHSETAFEATYEEQMQEENYAAEIVEESNFEEITQTKNYYANDPLEIEMESQISEYAAISREEILESQESEKEDFYSHNSFKEVSNEVEVNTSEMFEESVVETQFDEQQNTDFSHFDAPIEEKVKNQAEEIFGETFTVQPELSNNFEEQEVFEEESFEETNIAAEEDLNYESATDDFEVNSIFNGNSNGIAHHFEGEQVACAFCRTENDVQSFVCKDCNAVLTLSDLEMLLAHKDVDTELLRRAVEQMEAEQAKGYFSADDMTMLGIGCVNLKNLRDGLKYLRKAVKLEPTNVLLSSQVHSLAIRLAEIEEQESIHRSMPQDRTIMVVDDSATVRKLISGKLEKSGHTVVCAIDGIDALEKLKEFTPDLVLLDITMPRMDGYQVCKLIRNNPGMKDIPVVMISGKDGFFDKVRGRMAGTTGYITKPFGPETLMKTVEAFVSLRTDSIIEEEEVLVS